jgi:hypothetical protein
LHHFRLNGENPENGLPIFLKLVLEMHTYICNFIYGTHFNFSRDTANFSRRWNNHCVKAALRQIPDKNGWISVFLTEKIPRGQVVYTYYLHNGPGRYMVTSWCLHDIWPINFQCPEQNHLINCPTSCNIDISKWNGKK